MTIAPTSLGRRAIMLSALVVLMTAPAQAFDPNSALSLPPTTETALKNAGSLASTGSLAVPNAGSTVFDTTAPTAGAASAPDHAKANPVAVSYANADDQGGSGLKAVSLWMKYGAAGVWTDTGLKGAGNTGALAYTADLGDGDYYFSLKAEDNAGNTSPDPSGAGDTHVVYDTTRPVISVNGGDIAIEYGSVYTDPGATALDAQDGDITAKIATTNPVNTAAAGAYAVAYNVTDLAGNAAVEAGRVVTVMPASGYAVTLVQPAQGSILASPAPGAGGNYPVGTVVSFTYKPVTGSKYDLAGWTGATQDPANPNLARLTVNAAATVSANLTRQTGQVSVIVSPATATWTVTDGDSAKHDGTGSTLLNAVPTGAVSILYAPIGGSTTPSPQSATLAKGATVQFRGTYAGATSVLLSVPASLAGAPGQSVQCPISLNETSGLTDYSVRLEFDANVVECTGVTAGSATGAWGNPTANISSGVAVIAGTGTSLAAGTGAVALATLRVKAGIATPAQSALHLASAALNGAKLAVVTQDGVLQVQGGKFTWGDVNADGGVTIVDADVLLKYKTKLIDQLPSIAANTDPNSLGGADVSGETPPVAGVLDAALILKKTMGLLPAFPADANGDGVGPEPAGAAASASLASQLIKQFDQGTARIISTVGTIAVQTGTTLPVPVSIDNANAVQGYFFEMAYDKAQLDFVSLDKGALTREWGEPTINPLPGQIRVAGAGVKPLSGSGALVVVTFKVRATVPAGATTAITLTSADVNDGAIPSEVQEAQGSPTLESVSPNRGADTGGTMVTLKGVNLDFVNDVTFGGVSALWFRVHPEISSILAISPAGVGTADVTVLASGGDSTLKGTFTYFTPEVYLEMNPAAEIVAGSILDVPVTLTTSGGAKPSSLTCSLRYDPKLFTVKVSGAPDEQVSIGTDAASAGKSVVSIDPQPGKLTVTIGARSASTAAIPSGELCVFHLLATGSTENADGLLYLSDVSASAAASKSLTAAASVLPKRAGGAPPRP